MQSDSIIRKYCDTIEATMDKFDELEALATTIYHVSTFFIFKRIFLGHPPVYSAKT
jgi:hypothetical protein